MMKALDTRALKQISDTLIQEFPDLQAVYLFGSAGTKYERPASDVDLGMLAPRPQNPVAVWEVAQKLAARLGRDVDLVDLRRATTVMATQVIAANNRLLCTDINRCAEFEAHTFADYARLNEERRGILQDIQERGSVYGG